MIIILNNIWKKATFIFLSITLVMVLIACQPTPKDKAVIAKNGKLEQKVQKSPVSIKKYNFPDMYKMTFDSYNGSVKVNVNARIKLPETEKYPVIEVARAFFSQEQTDNLVRILMDGQKIFKNQRIRADIEKELIDMKQLYSEVKRGKYGINDFSFYMDQISKLEKELAATPENSVVEESDGKLVILDTGSELNIKADLGKKGAATLKIQNVNSNQFSSCSFLNGNQYFEDGGKEQAKGIKMTPDESLIAANDFLKKAGLYNIRPVYVRKGSVYSAGDKKSDCEGYVVVCARTVANVPITYNTAVGADKMLTNKGVEGQAPAFNPMLLNETFTLTYDDVGLTSFNWANPIDTKILNENVEILDFKKMMPLFQQAMINKYSWIKEPERVEGKVKGVEINIDRITLGLAKTPVKDKPGQYMLVPAWDFFGTYTEKYQTQEDSTVNNPYISFVTVNAIDGSIINLTS